MRRLRKSIKEFECAIGLEPKSRYSAQLTKEHRRQKEQLEQLMQCNRNALLDFGGTRVKHVIMIEVKYKSSFRYGNIFADLQLFFVRNNLI